MADPKGCTRSWSPHRVAMLDNKKWDGVDNASDHLSNTEANDESWLMSSLSQQLDDVQLRRNSTPYFDDVPRLPALQHWTSKAERETNNLQPTSEAVVKTPSSKSVYNLGIFQLNSNNLIESLILRRREVAIAVPRGPFCRESKFLLRSQSFDSIPWKPLGSTLS
ncbi:unnamed protein product [Citrullus colocynthis]|uniref:Uncharacterized protein n=1 Tax=Citrullus colocynthis TaxID=252529 RepID=A0ABP0YGL6_9ROSI